MRWWWWCRVTCKCPGLCMVPRSRQTGACWWEWSTGPGPTCSPAPAWCTGGHTRSPSPPGPGRTPPPPATGQTGSRHSSACCWTQARCLWWGSSRRRTEWEDTAIHCRPWKSVAVSRSQLLCCMLQCVRLTSPCEVPVVLVCDGVDWVKTHNKFKCWCYSSLSAHTTARGWPVFTVTLSHLSVPGWVLLSLGAPTSPTLSREFLSTIWCWATLYPK